MYNTCQREGICMQAAKRPAFQNVCTSPSLDQAAEDTMQDRTMNSWSGCGL